MKKPLTILVIFLILTLSVVLTHSSGQIQSPENNVDSNTQQGNLTFLQDTPEHVLDSFYANLLSKDYETRMAPLFYRREDYAPMVSAAFYSKVTGYKDNPVYTRQPVASSDYALYTITYTLRFKNIEEPVPFLDVLPLIKLDGKWYVFIEDPSATALEQAVTELYANPTYSKSESDHNLQLQTILTKYPSLADALT